MCYTHAQYNVAVRWKAHTHCIDICLPLYLSMHISEYLSIYLIYLIWYNLFNRYNLCIYLYTCVCVCVCVCAHTHTHTHTHTRIYIRVCVFCMQRFSRFAWLFDLSWWLKHSLSAGEVSSTCFPLNKNYLPVRILAGKTLWVGAVLKMSRYNHDLYVSVFPSVKLGFTESR